MATNSDPNVVSIGNSSSLTRPGSSLIVSDSHLKLPSQNFEIEAPIRLSLHEAREATGNVSKTRAALIITVLSGVSFLNTMGSGILTVALPQMAQDLELAQSLLFWPASVYALAAGCTLLIFGSIADVIGPKLIWQTGSGLFAAFTLGCGLCQNGTQLIIFRTLLGVCIGECDK